MLFDRDAIRRLLALRSSTLGHRAAAARASVARACWLLHLLFDFVLPLVERDDVDVSFYFEKNPKK